MKTLLARPFLPIALAVIVAACGSTSSTGTPGTSAAPSATPTSATTPTTTPPPASPSAGPTATGQPTTAADWPTYHLNLQRTGNSADFPAFSGTLTKAWAAKLDGAVYAEPLVVKGKVIAATEGDSVYSIDPTTGVTVWKQNLGTPAYDSATDTLFAVAEVTGPHHILFALDPATGAVRWQRNVDLSGDDPRTHQQRPALAVANGYVYIGFGGLAGDCGQYIGEEVGVPTNNQGDTLAYRVPVKREGAVWSTGGSVFDDKGNLYISTGNGSSTSKFDGSDSVVELSPKLELISYFAPANWAADNAADLDLGSLSPVLVPGGYVFIAGKRGTGYVLRQGALGGIGKQVASGAVCKAFGGAAQSGSTVYVPCRSELRAVTVGADGSMKVDWTNTDGGESPVVGGGAVWTLSGSQLFALDPATGKTIARITVGSLPHFASPTLWNGLAIVGTTSGLFAVKG